MSPSPPPEKLLHIPSPIRWFLVASAMAAALCLAVEAFCVRILHLGYPYDYPLLFREGSFDDFKWYYHQFTLLHTPAFFVGRDIIMYPAPVILCYRFFYSFHDHATAVFLAFILATFLTAAVLATRFLHRRGLSFGRSVLLVAATALLAYPAWFEFKQANMEIIVCILLAGGMAAVLKDRFWLAAVCFGVAAALKLFPVAMFGLLLSRKRYREICFGLVLAGLVMLGSLWYVGPTVPVAWAGMQYGLKQFHDTAMLVIRRPEIGFDHSLYTIVKIVLRQAYLIHLAPDMNMRQRAVLLDAYLAVVGSIGTAVYFLRIRKLPMLNQMFCLVLACILLPPVSFDYTLLHLYFPWLLLSGVAIAAARAGVFVPGLTAMFVCLGVATAPLSELIWRAEHSGGFPRAALLLAMFVLALRFPFELPSEVPAP